VRRPGRISRIGSERLRSALDMCALSAKRTNKARADFVGRLTAAGKPPKVILIAVARKLLVFAHAVILGTGVAQIAVRCRRVSRTGTASLLSSGGALRGGAAPFCRSRFDCSRSA